MADDHSPSPPTSPSGSEAQAPGWGAIGVLEAILIAACAGVLVYFFGFFKIFTNG